MDIYCLHCLTGHEHQVAGHVVRLGYESLVPLSNRVIVSDGRRKTQQRKLFPGYVFFRSDSLTADEIRFVTNSDHVIRLLRYDTGNYAFTAQDAQLIAWLWQHDGVFEVSQAYREGNRIRIISGPLKDLEAIIVKVNLKRSSVAIQLGESSLLGKIWCSIEMIENIDEENLLKR